MRVAAELADVLWENADAIVNQCVIRCNDKMLIVERVYKVNSDLDSHHQVSGDASLDLRDNCLREVHIDPAECFIAPENREGVAYGHVGRVPANNGGVVKSWGCHFLTEESPTTVCHREQEDGCKLD